MIGRRVSYTDRLDTTLPSDSTMMMRAHTTSGKLWAVASSPPSWSRSRWGRCSNAFYFFLAATVHQVTWWQMEDGQRLSKLSTASIT